MKTIDITIEGPRKSGKTTFAQALQCLRREYGIDFSITGDDEVGDLPPSKDYYLKFTDSVEDRLESLGREHSAEDITTAGKLQLNVRVVEKAYR